MQDPDKCHLTGAAKPETARWNLAEIINKFGCKAYSDFEGLTDGNKVLKACKVGEYYWWDLLTDHVEHEDREEYVKCLRDVILSILYEMADHDTRLTPARVEAVAYAANSILSCRYWTKSVLVS